MRTGARERHPFIKDYYSDLKQGRVWECGGDFALIWSDKIIMQVYEGLNAWTATLSECFLHTAMWRRKGKACRRESVPVREFKAERQRLPHSFCLATD